MSLVLIKILESLAEVTFVKHSLNSLDIEKSKIIMAFKKCLMKCWKQIMTSCCQLWVLLLGRTDSGVPMRLVWAPCFFKISAMLDCITHVLHIQTLILTDSKDLPLYHKKFAVMLSSRSYQVSLSKSGWKTWIFFDIVQYLFFNILQICLESVKLPFEQIYFGCR